MIDDDPLSAHHQRLGLADRIIIDGEIAELNVRTVDERESPAPAWIEGRVVRHQFFVVRDEGQFDIHGYVGGTLLPLELKTPYPEDYQQTVQQVVRENESGFLPPLRSETGDMARFDVVFVGFPTWGMQLPPPIKSFLRQHDLAGKRIVPFNSNGGYGTGSSFETVKELCSKSQVLAGYSVKDGSERDGVLLALKGERAEQARTEIKRWLQRSGLLK